MSLAGCKICLDPRRAEIDAALLAGTSMGVIGRQFALAKSTVHWHSKHARALLAKRLKATEPEFADRLFDELNRLRAAADKLRLKAEKAEDFRGALLAVRELARLVELQGKLTGQIRGSEFHITKTSVKMNMDIDRETADRIVRGYLDSRPPDGTKDESRILDVATNTNE